ncbi:polymeric immunoglobulin receptor-like isoform X2 [Labrus mixtus]|uniref:polymeric immunoglobulin receptor-like isoform X2 n=1 Tax=Labrus mixtus TaxID=508554 RepID=UPI0029C081E7|nr:polymeric immunoglobulin receptor-like isoform X2 [Labrus mixtus]
MKMLSLTFILCVALSGVSNSAALITVSGYEGKAVGISCSYGMGYESYEKYLCRNDCGGNDVLVTTTETSKNRFSIYDDKEKRVITASISGLTLADAGKYWCGVTRTGTDTYTEVKLLVGKDSCCDQSTRIQSYEDSSVDLSCPYEQKDQNNLKYICRGNQPSTCLQQALVTSDYKQKGYFSLADNKMSMKFTVTITSLTLKDSGPYLCGVQRKSDLDVFTAVSLEVNEWCCVESSEQSGIVGHPLSIQCPYPPQHWDNRKFLCKGDHRKNCTDVMSQSRFSLQDNVSSSSFSVMITGTKVEDAGTYWCGSDSQWTVGNYTKIHLSLDAEHFLSVGVTLPTVGAIVLVILIISVVIIYKYKCRRAQGTKIIEKRNQTKVAGVEEVIDVADIYENQGAAVCSKQETSKWHSSCHQNDNDDVYQNCSTTEDMYCNQSYMKKAKR